MKHRIFGKKLSRTKNERRLLFQNQLRSLIQYGKIRTTLSRARAVQPLAERLITKAKKPNQVKRREVHAVLDDKRSTTRLFERASTQFADRASGFTRIVKLGTRRGDNAEEAMFMFVDQEIETEVIKPKTSTRKETKKTDSKKKEEKQTTKPKAKSKKSATKRTAKPSKKTS